MGNETRDSLSRAVSRTTGFTHENCRNVLDTLLVEIICRAREDGSVQIRSFGTFLSYVKEKRPVYNFHTKEMFSWPKTRTLAFHPHVPLRKAINGDVN